MAIADASPCQRRLTDLTLDFLADLELERGLSRNTLEAYRSDLQQFGVFLARRDRDPLEVGTARPGGVRVRAGRRARRQAAGRARHPAAQDRVPALVLPPPAPRADHRPRPHRRAAPAPLAAGGCPKVLSRDEVNRLLAQPRGTAPAALRDRALLETMYACGLRASEAITLELSELDLEAGMLRARGKGSKERLVPIGSKAVGDAHGLPGPRPPAAGGHPRRAARVRQPARRRPVAPGPVPDRPEPRPQRRPGAAHEPAHAPAHVRHPSAGRRVRPALAAGDARPRRHRHHPGLHASVGGPSARRLLRRPSAGADRPDASAPDARRARRAGRARRPAGASG